MSSNQESSSGGLLKWIVDDESNKHNESITPIEREIHERSYHSSSSENDFDAYEDRVTRSGRGAEPRVVQVLRGAPPNGGSR